MAKVTDIQDKNGVSKEIQDKDLANRTSQSTVASTDYILLEDTDGAYHKIAKASFTEAVRGALGSVINSVAKGTDIAKVPVLDSNNDLGMGTLANLASVLGVPLYSKVTIDSSITTSIQAAYDGASFNTKFDGTITDVGYYLGMKGSTDGKAGVLLLRPNSTYILHRNFGSITSGKWTVFKVTA